MSESGNANPAEIAAWLIIGLACGGALGGMAEERKRRREKQDSDLAQIKRDLAKLREGAAE